MPDTIDDLAVHVDRWVALEDLLFQTLGRWATTVPEPAHKRAFATWCHRHAWHAELWRARRPTYQGRTDVGALDGRIGAETEAWIEPLRRVLTAADAVGTEAKVSVLTDAIVPTMQAALDEHRGAIDVRLDGPTARVLDLVATDLAGERAALTP